MKLELKQAATIVTFTMVLPAAADVIYSNYLNTTILTGTDTLTGFNAANWSINTNDFTDLDTGIWALGQSGNNLVLSYTVIPEPNVAALPGGLGALMLLRRRR